MKASITNWLDTPMDQPIPFLDRKKVEGEEMLVARVTLHPGCEVAVHSHRSEQIAVILSGKVKWILGDEGEEVIVEGGSVVHLPSFYPHGVVAIEETHIIDILAPKGAMGVDSQNS
ncbi:MAG: cupin domain-containing protein [Armatimonadetes bacterium]|nr:cupin domain-containing protein [Armatimonadota bacterium]